MLAKFPIESWSNAISSCKPLVASHCLRTMLNTWTTSNRMRGIDGSGFCIFKCAQQPDALHHYVQCETLWATICAHFQINIFFLLARLKITDCLISRQAVAACSYAYHALKGERTFNSKLDAQEDIQRATKAFACLSKISTVALARLL